MRRRLHIAQIAGIAALGGCGRIGFDATPASTNPQVGTCTLTAVPYSSGEAAGTPGAPVTFDITP